MKGLVAKEDALSLQKHGKWLRVADYLARFAWPCVLISIAIGLLGGLITSLTWQPSIDTGVVEENVCTQPPCFSLDLDGLRLRNLPSVLWLPVYLLALAVSFPSLLVGLVNVVQGQWKQGGWRMLLFVGPVLIFVGTEIVPHIVLPCAFYPQVCEPGPQGRWDVAGKWHLLDHMLVGAVPLVIVYWVTLRMLGSAARRNHHTHKFQQPVTHSFRGRVRTW